MCIIPTSMSNKRKNLVGKRFGRLTVIEFIKSDHRRQSVWLCKCDCGNKCNVLAGNLQNSHTRSCGCIQKEHSAQLNKGTHNMCSTRLYTIFEGIKDRCFNANSKVYRNYGGRGITVCDEWRNNFKAFYDWAMSHGYTDDLTIDRIDNDGNYCPENCRWTTYKEQARNKRSNRNIEYNGKTQCLSRWAEDCGIKVSTLSERFRRGWSIEKALNYKQRG